jgi:hypothetical protein
MSAWRNVRLAVHLRRPIPMFVPLSERNKTGLAIAVSQQTALDGYPGAVANWTVTPAAIVSVTFTATTREVADPKGFRQASVGVTANGVRRAYLWTVGKIGDRMQSELVAAFKAMTARTCGPAQAEAKS